MYNKDCLIVALLCHCFITLHAGVYKKRVKIQMKHRLLPSFHLRQCIIISAKDEAEDKGATSSEGKEERSV